MAVLVAIVAGSLIAFLHPDLLLPLRPALQPAFAVTMLFVGTLVRREEIESFLEAPLRPLYGLAAQYTIMPVLAWVLSLAFDDPLLRTGVVLVGCMPGAMASNVMTVLFRGDVVLSVTLTTLATLATPLVLALWLPWLADTRLTVPIGSLVWNAIWMVVLPVLLGIGIRQQIARLPALWDQVATSIASASIVLIVLVVVAINHEALRVIGIPLAGAMVALNLLGYGLAYVTARWLRWPPAQVRTLVIEVGMQNAGLGSLLALHHLGERGALPSAFYTVLCVVTAAAALPVAGGVRQPGRPAAGS